MPTYEYECTKCQHRFEIFQKITDEPIRECQSCGGPVRKLMFPVGIVFKGSGFHITDYGRKSSGNGNGNKKIEETKSSTESSSAASTASDK